MTAQELHDLVDPIREAMDKDGLWPERHGCFLQYDIGEMEESGGFWSWCDGKAADPCETTDAHNAILVALLGWLPKDHILCRSIYEDGTSEWTVEEELTHCNAIHGSGTVPIHALVSAYRTEKGLQ